MASIFRQIGLTFVVVIVCVALHEVGHLIAAKALGYDTTKIQTTSWQTNRLAEPEAASPEKVGL